MIYLGELGTDQGIACCKLTSLTYLTWLVCWTPVEIAHYRVALYAVDPETDTYICTTATMVYWRALQRKDLLHWLDSQSQHTVCIMKP